MDIFENASHKMMIVRTFRNVVNSKLLHLLFFVVSRSLCESFALGVRLVSPGKEIYKSARNVITVMLRRIH